MKIAVIGRSGQVAQALLERGAKQGLEIVCFGRPSLDLADEYSIVRALSSLQCDVVINAAAYTAVDRAESEEALATAINGRGAGAVADVAAKLGLPFLHISTDYVFAGDGKEPYSESDMTSPLSAYGRSKLAGEIAVMAANPRSAIFRTSWVYSPFGSNFVKTMLRLGETRSEVSVVADQVGSPTSAFDIADALISASRRIVAEPTNKDLFGVFHLTGTSEASWAEFAEAIFAFRASAGQPMVSVKPITTADYPTPARRPANSRLSCKKLELIYGLQLPDWHESLNVTLARLLDAQQV